MVDIKLDDCINDNAQQLVTAEMMLLGSFMKQADLYN